MRCFRALCGPPELAEGLLPLSEGDVLVHVENTESNGWHLGICNGNVGFFCFDDVVSTELPASPDDVAIFLDIQRSHTARRDSQTSIVSASSSAATAATIKTSRERSANPRPSLGDSNGELASFLHSIPGREYDTDVRRHPPPDSSHEQTAPDTFAGRCGFRGIGIASSSGRAFVGLIQL